MRLLIITQKVDKNDDNLGFFHGWLEEFARRTEKVIVIAQYVGQYDFPQNVEIFSLGKEKGYSKIRQLFNFYKLLLKNLGKADAVFVHMIPLWVVLGAPLFKIYGKKVYLWYVHKSVNLRLKLAEKFVNLIFSASPESCRLKSDKIIITGHGIDVNKFQNSGLRIQDSKFMIISTGRIAPIKNYEILIEVADILRNRRFDFEIKIAGQPITEQDKIYFEKLKKIIRGKNLENIMTFAGSIPYRNMAEFYQKGDLFINLSDTGSIDKAVLEAMASGLSILTSNIAFKNILPGKYFTGKDPGEIAEKITGLSKNNSDPGLADYVVKNHSLDRLIIKIISLMNYE